MKKKTNYFKAILAVITLMMILASCSTSVGITYQQPSNVNMGSYRNVAIASAVPYEGYSNVPMYIRFEVSDPTIMLYSIFSTYDARNLGKAAAGEVTKMVSKVFTQTPYYSVMGTDKTDTYLSLYKIGKDPSALLKEEGIDAVIIPKITALYNDEYVEASYSKDAQGNKTAKYYINRVIRINISVTVLDTATNRIVAVKEYSASDSYIELFDPKFPYLFTYSQADLMKDTVASMISKIVSDFVPTTKRTYVSLMSNKPKIESLKSAYSAASEGNYGYALNAFLEAWRTQGHVASAYNAAIIISSQGDLDGAISLLDEVMYSVSNSEVNRLYANLIDLRERNRAAQKQYAASDGKREESSTSPYEYLLN